MKKLFLFSFVTLGFFSFPVLSAQDTSCENQLAHKTPELTDKALAHIVFGDIVVQKGRAAGKSYSREVPKLNGGMHTTEGLRGFLEKRRSAGSSIVDVDDAINDVKSATYKHQKDSGKTISRVSTYSLLTFPSGISQVSLPEEALSYLKLLDVRDSTTDKDSQKNKFSGQAKITTLFPDTENIAEDLKGWIAQILEGIDSEKSISQDKEMIKYVGWVQYKNTREKISHFKMKVVVYQKTNQVVTAYPIVTENTTLDPASSVFHTGVAICLSRDNSSAPYENLLDYASALKAHLYEIESSELNGYLDRKTRRALFELRDSNASREETLQTVYNLFSKYARRLSKKKKIRSKGI